MISPRITSLHGITVYSRFITHHIAIDGDETSFPGGGMCIDFYGRCLICANYAGLLISPSGISELDCATTKTDTAERSISIGRESLQFLFVLPALAYCQDPPLGGSRDEK